MRAQAEAILGPLDHAGHLDHSAGQSHLLTHDGRLILRLASETLSRGCCRNPGQEPQAPASRHQAPAETTYNTRIKRLLYSNQLEKNAIEKILIKIVLISR